jgi:hypothetical protein
VQNGHISDHSSNVSGALRARVMDLEVANCFVSVLFQICAGFKSQHHNQIIDYPQGK